MMHMIFDEIITIGLGAVFALLILIFIVLMVMLIDAIISM
jgi:hypothetical protein